MRSEYHIHVYNASFFKYYGVSKIFKETVLIVTCPIEYANKCTRLARSLGCTTHTKCSMHRTEVRERAQKPKIISDTQQHEVDTLYHTRKTILNQSCRSKSLLFVDAM
jgi:hypothetical protein